VNTKISKTE